MQDYLKKNPPVNEDMLRSMMMSMGQNLLRKNSSDDAANEKPKVGFSKSGLILSARFLLRQTAATNQKCPQATLFISVL